MRWRISEEYKISDNETERLRQTLANTVLLCREVRMHQELDHEHEKVDRTVEEPTI